MNWKLRTKRRLDVARGWWKSKDVVSQLYLSALITTLVAMLLLSWSPGNWAAVMLVRFAFLIFAVTFLREVYTWIIPKLELPLVKLAVAAFGVMAAATATGVSRIVVSEATGQDPAYFGTTVALLVPVSFIPIAAAMVLVGGVLILPATMLWMLLQSLRSWTKPSDRIVLLGCARAFACLVVVGGATSLLKPASPLFLSLRWLAGQSAHVLDAQPNSACALAGDDRVLRINDGLIVLSRMTEDGPQFVRRVCELAEEETPLRSGVSSRPSRENNRLTH